LLKVRDRGSGLLIHVKVLNAQALDRRHDVRTAREQLAAHHVDADESERRRSTTCSSSRRRPATASDLPQQHGKRSTSEPRVSHHIRTGYHTCLTEFAPVSHQNHTCLTRIRSCLKKYRTCATPAVCPLLWRSSTLKAHAVPTRPTDRSTFGTSISLIPTTWDPSPALSLACRCTPCPTAIPSNSVTVPLLPIGFYQPTESLTFSPPQIPNVGPIRRTRHASSRPCATRRSGTC
jgi:hypothetical protein